MHTTNKQIARCTRIGAFLMALVLAGTLAAGGIATAQDAVQIEVVTPSSPATPIGDTLLENPVTGISHLVTFAPDQWTGAAPVTNATTYFGRPAVALYAQSTETGTASLNFQLSDSPTSDVLLTIVGMDDDSSIKTPIEVTINETSVYTGDAWFADWGGKKGEGDWTTVQFTIPAGMLSPGVNYFTISNTTKTGTLGDSPYIVLGGALMEVTEANVELSGQFTSPGQS